MANRDRERHAAMLSELEEAAEHLGPDCLRTVKEVQAEVDAAWAKMEAEERQADDAS